MDAPIIAAMITGAAAIVGPVIAHYVTKRVERRRIKESMSYPLDPGYWAFRLQNEVEGPQYYGVFELRYEGLRVRVLHGGTWVAGRAPSERTKWACWSTSITAFDNNHLFALFQLQLQFIGPSRPQDYQAILKLQRRDARSVTGHYNSFRLIKPRFGPMEAWHKGESVSDAETSAFRSYAEEEINDKTRALLAECDRCTRES